MITTSKSEHVVREDGRTAFRASVVVKNAATPEEAEKTARAELDCLTEEHRRDGWEQVRCLVRADFYHPGNGYHAEGGALYLEPQPQEQQS